MPITSRHQFLTCFVLMWIELAHGHVPKDVYLMGLIPFGGDVWPAGEAIMAAINMALEQINNRTDVLSGYRLNLIVDDTQVKYTTSTQHDDACIVRWFLFEQIYR